MVSSFYRLFLSAQTIKLTVIFFSVQACNATIWLQKKALHWTNCMNGTRLWGVTVVDADDGVLTILP